MNTNAPNSRNSQFQQAVSNSDVSKPSSTPEHLTERWKELVRVECLNRLAATLRDPRMGYCH